MWVRTYRYVSFSLLYDLEIHGHFKHNDMLQNEIGSSILSPILFLAQKVLLIPLEMTYYIDGRHSQ